MSNSSCSPQRPDGRARPMLPPQCAHVQIVGTSALNYITAIFKVVCRTHRRLSDDMHKHDAAASATPMVLYVQRRYSRVSPFYSRYPLLWLRTALWYSSAGSCRSSLSCSVQIQAVPAEASKQPTESILCSDLPRRACLGADMRALSMSSNVPVLLLNPPSKRLNLIRITQISPE